MERQLSPKQGEMVSDYSAALTQFRKANAFAEPHEGQLRF